MWVLSPVVGTNTQVQDVHESLWYLARPGQIAVGRPGKQGKAKVDGKYVLVLTDTSVSKRHATLEVVPPSTPHDSPKLTITGVDAGHYYDAAAAVGVALLRTEPGASLPDQVSNPGDVGSIGLLVVDEGANATPLLALALLLGVPLVRRSWLHALLGEPRVWRDSLPGADAHAVAGLVLPGIADKGRQRGSSGQMLQLSGWKTPASDLLAGYTLAMVEQDPNLMEAAELLGAAVEAWQLGQSPPVPAANTQVLAVLPDSFDPCQGGGAPVALALPSVSVGELLVSMLRGDTLSLCEAASAWSTARSRSGPEVLGSHAVAHGVAEEAEDSVLQASDVTELGEESEGAVPQQVVGDVTGNGSGALSKQQAGGDGGDAGAAARESDGGMEADLGPSPSAGKVPSDAALRAAQAAVKAAEEAAEGSERVKGKTAGGGKAGGARKAGTKGGAKRALLDDTLEEGGAAGAEATAAEASPSFKVARHESADMPGGTASGTATAEGTVYTDGSVTVLVKSLLVPALIQAAQRERALAAAGGRPPNFKAFRHKPDAGAPPRHGGPVLVRTEVYVAPALEDAEETTFLKEEKRRQSRLRKADELFNAVIKPTKASTAHTAPPPRKR